MHRVSLSAWVFSSRSAMATGKERVQERELETKSRRRSGSPAAVAVGGGTAATMHNENEANSFFRLLHCRRWELLPDNKHHSYWAISSALWQCTKLELKLEQSPPFFGESPQELLSSKAIVLSDLKTRARPSSPHQGSTEQWLQNEGV